MGYKCICRTITDAQARQAKEEVKREYGTQAFNKKAASPNEEDLKELEREVHRRSNDAARDGGFNCGTCRMAFRALICEDLDSDDNDHQSPDFNESPDHDQGMCCRVRPDSTKPGECRPD